VGAQPRHDAGVGGYLDGLKNGAEVVALYAKLA